MMICEKCGKKTHTIYIKRNLGFVCEECKKQVCKDDTLTKWEKLCERMQKKYGRYK